MIYALDIDKIKISETEKESEQALTCSYMQFDINCMSLTTDMSVSCHKYIISKYVIQTRSKSLKMM